MSKSSLHSEHSLHSESSIHSGASLDSEPSLPSNSPFHATKSTPQDLESPTRRFLQGFVEGNYFYVFSAVFMLLGAKLLMRHPLAAATEFSRVLQTLFVLQGYELLVIATAILIVRRFRRMGDAFTLLIIELALLLDPTFFNNNFFTIPNTEPSAPSGYWVNITCLALVPVKLLILQWALRIRLSSRSLISFLFTGVVCYLMSGPLNQEAPLLTKAGWYYLIAWMPLILCLLAPRLGDVFSIAAPQPDYITPRQSLWLSRFLLMIPPIILLAHFFEDCFVYDIRFYVAYLPPLILAGVVLILRFGRREQASQLIVGVDALCLCALIFSTGLFNLSTSSKGVSVGIRQPDPELILRGIPLYVCGAVVAASYLAFFLRFRHRPALWRIGFLAAGAGIHGLIHYGIMTTIMGLIKSVFSSFLNPWIIVAALWILVWRFRNLGTFFAAGAYSLWLLTGFLPGNRIHWIPELLQGILGLWMILSHQFGNDRQQPLRNFAAIMMCLLGLGRCVDEESLWSAMICVLECVAIGWAGIRLRRNGYILIATLQGILLIGIGFVNLPLRVPPAAVVLIISLILFGIGLLVTFQKSRILGWMNSEELPAVGGDSSNAAVLPVPTTPLPPSSTPTSDSSDLMDQTDRSDQTDQLNQTDHLDQMDQLDRCNRSDQSDQTDRSDRSNQSDQSDRSGQSDQSDSVSLQESFLLAASGEFPSSSSKAFDLERCVALLQMIFFQDSKDKIVSGESLPSEACRSLARSLSFQPDEYIVWDIVDPAFPQWRLLLTSHRLFIREGSDIHFIHYEQIAAISRQLGALFFTGHSDQVVSCSGLTPRQASIVKKGLESLLSELAIDPPSPPSPSSPPSLPSRSESCPPPNAG